MPFYTFHVSDDIVHDFCGVINQQLPTLMYDRQIETQRCWQDLSALRQSQMNIIKQKKHIANEKHYLISETAKQKLNHHNWTTLLPWDVLARTTIRVAACKHRFTHQNTVVKLHTHHLAHAWCQVHCTTWGLLISGIQAGQITSFFFETREKQRDCAPTSFSAVLIMSQSTLDRADAKKKNKARLAQTRRSVERQWREKQASSLAKTDRRNHDQKQRQNTRIIWATMKDVTWDLMNCVT